MRGRAEALLAQLGKGDFRAARVAEMVSNSPRPANLCLVHRDRVALPRGLVRLHQECVEVLLDGWGCGGQSVNVTGEQGRRVLQPAAPWLHEGRPNPGNSGRACASAGAGAAGRALGRWQRGSGCCPDA